MVKVKVLILTLAAVWTVLAATPAGAITITQGQEIDVTFAPPAGNPDLFASLTLVLSTLTDTTATFDFSVTNSNTEGPNVRLSGIGFAMAPTPTAGSATAIIDIGGATDTDRFVAAATPGNIPSLNGENVCSWVGNNCSASNAGLLQGETDEFRFSVSGTFDPQTGIDFTLFGVKWASCEGCSFEVFGTPTAVPEPGTLMLLGTGLAALGGLGKRRLKKK